MDRADHIAAWATGIGGGLLAFMITWLMGARITGRVWSQPAAAIIALLSASVIGVGIAVWAGRRLASSQRSRLGATSRPDSGA